MIHEIFPHQLDNHFVITNNIVENDYILQYNEHDILLKVDGGDFELARKKMFRPCSALQKVLIYLWSMMYVVFLSGISQRPPTTSLFTKTLVSCATLNQKKLPG